MLIERKIFKLFTLILILSLSSLSFRALAAEQNTSTHEQLINQVELLFKENPEKLNYDNIVKLSNTIFLQREIYPNETLAKTYLLLSNVASNQGELETAYQFIQDALATLIGNKKIKLGLQIKLASILLAKKHYKHLLKVAQQVMETPFENENNKYFLSALSYRSVALAKLGKHEGAFRDLQKVESIIKQTEHLAKHIPLLTIMASTYYYLNDYQTALTRYLHVLQLRFNFDMLENVDQTYYRIANTHYRLNRYNDAYNAYWEAKKYAEKKSAPIYAAYAYQGLGLTLIQQKQFIEARAQTLKAKGLFYQYNLARPHLETTISLALISHLTKQNQTTAKLLIEAESLSLNIEITDNYIVLYQLLSDMYKEAEDIKKAYFWQLKYSTALLKLRQSEISSHQLLTKQTSRITPISIPANSQSQQLAIKLAEQNQLTAKFSKQYNQQKTRIFILSMTVVMLLIFIVFSWLKHRSTKLQKEHEVLQQLNDIITAPPQTKHHYQKSFNMAKKYSYPLTFGYISISNWQDLTHQFNKKIVAEAKDEITTVITSHINEFEFSGLLNEGEYLLTFPHQHENEVTMVIEALVATLKLRFFANLSDFSIITVYSIASVELQDSEPSVFLSQLKKTTKIA